MLAFKEDMSTVEYDIYLKDHLKKELSTLPHPLYVTSLFPDASITICRPLDPPFNLFSITHNGYVFKHHPLITQKIYGRRSIDPTQIVHQYLLNGNPVISLIDHCDKKRTFLVYRLLLDKFYNIPYTSRIEINFLDNDPTNVHIANVEAFFV